MSLKFIKLSRLLCHSKDFINVTSLGYRSYNMLSFFRISRHQLKYKHSAIENYRSYGRSHVKVSPFLYYKSTQTSQMTLLNRCHRCCYSSSTKKDSEDDGDSFEDISKDPEVQSFLQNIKDDFKVNNNNSQNENLDENKTKESENVVSNVSQLAGSNENLVTSEKSDVETVDDSDIEDFLDYQFMDDSEIEEFEPQPYIPPIELKRGKTGVFDLEELVTVLKEENARDLCVISVPANINYVDYLVLVSGISPRHIKSMAELFKWLYKQRRSRNDPPLHIEGLQTNNWIAMDLGNIALHIFLPHVRELYDLETLWTVGAEYDDKCREAEDQYIITNPSLLSSQGSNTEEKETSVHITQL